MRHRRRVARFFSTDDNDDDDGDDDLSRTPDLPARSELNGDSISSSPPLLIHPLLFILFIELTRNREIHRQLSLIRGSSCIGHEQSRLRSAVGQVELTCDKLAFLIRIFGTKHQRDVDSAEFMKDS